MTETIVHLKPKRAVAAGHDARWAARRDGASGAASGRLQHLDDADHQPHRHADDRHPLGSGREDLRHRPDRCSKDLARKVADAVRRVPGASNVYPEQVTSGQYLNIEVDRDAAARYGIGVGDIQQVIETAIGETTLTTTIEGRQRFPVRVRYAPEYRADPQALGQRPRGRVQRRADPAQPGRSDRARAWSRDDLVGERPAARDGAAERAGPRRRRLRRGSPRDRRTRRRAASGLLRRLERPVGEPGTRASQRCRSSCRSCCS